MCVLLVNKKKITKEMFGTRFNELGIARGRTLHFSRDFDAGLGFTSRRSRFTYDAPVHASQPTAMASFLFGEWHAATRPPLSCKTHVKSLAADAADAPDEPCCICLDALRRSDGDGKDLLVLVSCGHVLHKSCVHMVATAQGESFKCPLCRTSYTRAGCPAHAPCH